MTPRSPDPAQVHCEALGKGLLDGDPGPLTHTHIPGPCHSFAHRCMSPRSSHCFRGDNGVTPSPLFLSATKLPSKSRLMQARAGSQGNKLEKKMLIKGH